jgi:hypothetical protein
LITGNTRGIAASETGSAIRSCGWLYLRLSTYTGLFAFLLDEMSVTVITADCKQKYIRNGIGTIRQAVNPAWRFVNIA